MIDYTSLQIEEIKNQRAVSFYANDSKPEEHAWELFRKWAVENIKDYMLRRCIGFSPVGHHPVSEDDDTHEYIAQMFLCGEEGKEDNFLGANVSDVPGGLFLVGEINIDAFSDVGSVDIGTAMKQTSQDMYNCLKKIGSYDIDMNGRPFIEEHFFPKEWFEGTAEVPKYKIWLPIKSIS